MNLFSRKTSITDAKSDFGYLGSDNFYFDSACQTLRPNSVIEKEVEYYRNYNSCGHRVKYKWGQITDEHVDETRSRLLKLVNKRADEYVVAFTLNTTFGINQILQQTPAIKYKSIITSDIEHNSVFLPTLVYAQKHHLERIVLERSTNPEDFGALKYIPEKLERAIVVVNTTSNINGANLQNLKKLSEDIHKQSGLLYLDVCQTLNHSPELLKDVDFDACFGSGHKMYGPSVGFIIIKRRLLETLDYFLIGGSTVADVKMDSFELISGDEIYSRIEPGLQNYAGIIGLGEAIQWRSEFRKNGLSAEKYEKALSEKLNTELNSIPGLNLLNPNPSPIVSFYSDKIDSHKLGTYLNQKNIMCRTGYHCCHYYLKEKLNLPPLLRVSLGLQNTDHDIDVLIDTLRFIFKNY